MSIPLAYLNILPWLDLNLAFIGPFIDRSSFSIAEARRISDYNLSPRSCLSFWRINCKQNCFKTRNKVWFVFHLSHWRSSKHFRSPIFRSLPSKLNNKSKNNTNKGLNNIQQIVTLLAIRISLGVPQRHSRRIETLWTFRSKVKLIHQKFRIQKSVHCYLCF